MLAERGERGLDVEPAQRRVGEREADALERGEDAPARELVEQPGALRVEAVERDADRDGLAVPERAVGDFLERVRRPVPEVERPRGAELERVAAAADVLEV